MPVVWTCHRCETSVRSDELHGDDEPVGEERDLPEGWIRIVALTVDEGETSERQVDFYVDHEPRVDVQFCDPCSNHVLTTLGAGLKGTP